MSAIRVDSDDPTPPFEQIRRQLAVLMDAGELDVGERLPTVRQLANDLHVAAGTVARAYKELESAGYVETRRAAGTRVLARATAEPFVDLDDLAQAYVSAAVARGATPGQIEVALAAALRRARG